MIQNRSHLTSVVWSAVLILLLPMALAILTTISYGLLVGFQSRGDQAVIAQSVASFAGSLGFQIFTLLLLGLVVFWRARVLAAQTGRQALLYVMAVVVLALLARLVIDLIRADLQPFSTLLAWCLGLGVGLLAVATGEASPEA